MKTNSSEAELINITQFITTNEHTAKTIRSLVVHREQLLFYRSAAVERLFSAAAQVLTLRRCRMTDDALDRLLFLRSVRK